MNPQPESAAGLVERLRRLDACAVSDALDTHGLRGVLPGLRPLWPCGRIAGRVVTVRLVPVQEAPPARVHLGAAAVAVAGPGDVIVVDNRGRVDCGAWGGLLTLAARQAGVAGVVVHGACRDISEAEELAFPVYGLATTPVTARSRVAEASTGSPLDLAGVEVRAGDFVLADRSGVVAVPAAHAAAVIGDAERILEREWAMADRLRAGASPQEVLGAAYEDMLRPRG
ncbi:MAG: RraA family protein [Acidimicrobiia bacterium]